MRAKDGKSVEQMIKEVQGTMAIEGMDLTAEDIQLLLDCAEGKITYEDAIENLVKMYTVPDSKGE